VTDWQPIETAPDWISVSDRLPPLYRQVVLMQVGRYWCVPDCAGDMHVNAIGYLADNYGREYWAIHGERGMEIDAFSHWMPLPAPPAQEGEG
jgi:hypothetical protein